MSRSILYLLLLIVGILIGFFIRPLFNPEVAEMETKPKEIVVEKVKIKDKIVRDTIVIEKIIPLPQTQDSSLLNEITETDSVQNSLPSDEFSVNPNLTDENSEENEEEIIIREELIAKRTIHLKQLPKDTTDVTELLELKSLSFSSQISVEFWKSPLDIIGYELSRNRLKLFGFNPNESFHLKIGNDGEHLILNTETMSILLRKTDRFLTLNLK